MNVAARYARALFSLTGDATLRQQQLEALSSACTTPPALAFWQHPGVALRDRQELAAKVAACVDSSNRHLRNFLLLLVEQQRMQLLPSIAALHAELVKKQAGIVDVTVTSSHPLQDTQQEEVTNAVTAHLQKKLNIAFAVNADILGGLIVAWEHRVWDFSLSTKLQAIIKHAVG